MDIYPRMALNYGYDEEYVDEKMDMERLFAHLLYLKECPPPGMLIRMYFEAQSGSSTTSSYSTVQSYRPSPKKEFKSEDEKRNYERAMLNNLCADFGVNVNNLQKKPRRKLRILPSQRKGGKHDG